MKSNSPGESSELSEFGAPGLSSHTYIHIMPPASSFINLTQRDDITNKHSLLCL